MLLPVIFLAAAGVLGVTAQSSDTKPAASGSNPATTSTRPDLSALTPCVLGCITAAARATVCGTFTNVTCICTDADYQQKAASCLQVECKSDEFVAALALEQAQCGDLSVTSVPTATAPFLPSNSAAVFTPTTRPASSSKSGTTSSTLKTAAGPNPSPSASDQGENFKLSSTPLSPIVGGVVGGLAFLILCVAAGVCLLRRRKRPGKRQPERDILDLDPPGYHPTPAHAQKAVPLSALISTSYNRPVGNTTSPGPPTAFVPAPTTSGTQEPSASSTWTCASALSTSTDGTVHELRAQVHDLQGQVHALTHRLNLNIQLEQRVSTSTANGIPSPPPSYRAGPRSDFCDAKEEDGVPLEGRLQPR
ncbi:CFEM domain-containing protein [Mycena kentingensis (nom. inval.)]|nr:CFEM domain-containing protein [Mycena kentingensis (nom. inval.)]